MFNMHMHWDTSMFYNVYALIYNDLTQNFILCLPIHFQRGDRVWTAADQTKTMHSHPDGNIWAAALSKFIKDALISHDALGTITPPYTVTAAGF